MTQLIKPTECGLAHRRIEQLAAGYIRNQSGPSTDARILNKERIIVGGLLNCRLGLCLFWGASSRSLSATPAVGN
jgi:hypothetical protein